MSTPTDAFHAALAAVMAGDIDALRKVVAGSPGVVHERVVGAHPPYDGYFAGATLLHHVSGNPLPEQMPANAVDVTQVLLEAGAEVDAETVFGEWSWTPLGLVASGSRPLHAGLTGPLVDQLVGAGADVNARNGIVLYGALYHVVEDRRMRESAELIRAKGAQVDLMGAAALGELDTLDTLAPAPGRLADGAYRRYRPPRDRLADPTPQAVLDEALAFAAANARPEAVDHLLALGAQLTGVTSIAGHRVTPLHCAAWAGWPDMVAKLVAAGADLALRDSVYNGTPPEWAWHCRRTEALDEFVRVADRMTLTDQVQFAPLDIVTVALAGCDADAPPPGGTPGTLLRAAANAGRADVVEWLIAAGADPNRAGSSGNTALGLAQRAGHNHVVDLLRRHGATQ